MPHNRLRREIDALKRNGGATSLPFEADSLLDRALAALGGPVAPERVPEKPSIPPTSVPDATGDSTPLEVHPLDAPHVADICEEDEADEEVRRAVRQDMDPADEGVEYDPGYTIGDPGDETGNRTVQC